MTEDSKGRKVADDPPPILGTWRRIYLAVLAYLFTVILLFWLFGRAATP